MTDIDPDTEDLLRRRPHQLAAHGTAGATWTPGRASTASTTGSSTSAPVEDAPVLATVQPLARTGRHRPFRRPGAIAVALSAAAAVLVAVVAITGGGEQANGPIFADNADVTTTVQDSTDAPPYLELSGTRWVLTGRSPDAITADNPDPVWLEITDPTAFPPIQFVAGFAYSSDQCAGDHG